MQDQRYTGFAVSIEYIDAIAAHYAAYRPPLHELILSRALGESSVFREGLDIGCGTGRSSIALSKFCEHVSGVEPSRPMLNLTEPMDSISYSLGKAEDLPIEDNTVDIVTFAGSLSYADPDRTAKELLRVCRPTALILPYDFSLGIETFLESMGVFQTEDVSNYDHAAGFPKNLGLRLITSVHEQIELHLGATDLAHVLLADRSRYNSLSQLFGTSDPHTALSHRLHHEFAAQKITADIYYALYRPSEPPPFSS